MLLLPSCQTSAVAMSDGSEDDSPQSSNSLNFDDVASNATLNSPMGKRMLQTPTVLSYQTSPGTCAISESVGCTNKQAIPMTW